jgi:peptidoglycan/LPS O-acetylase OafA/YrhL
MTLPAAIPAKGRLAFLDNLKACLAALVVFHHAGQPYGPTGGSWPIFHAEKFGLLGPFFHINASFFMGLFFLISAYFLPQAFARKGPAGFLADRFRRFGLPVLAYGLVMFPAYEHYLKGKAWADSFLPFEWAHLWFLGHLMIYALLYTAYRIWHGASADDAHNLPFPSSKALLMYVLGLTAVDLVVRAWYPIDYWGRFVVTAEIAHLPQYASLFLFGLVASREHWLENIPEKTGRLWLGVAVAGTLARFGYTVAHADFISHDGLLCDTAWNLWEALICTGMCVGLPYWFSRHVAGEGRFARFAGHSAFSTYVLHLPILVLVQLAMEKTTLGPLALTVLTGAITLALCYVIYALYELAIRQGQPKQLAVEAG